MGDEQSGGANPNVNQGSGGARPPLPPGGNARNQAAGGSAVDPLIPSADEVSTLPTAVVANKVASRDTVTAILAELKSSASNATALDLMALAWACYHNGSSRYTTLEGSTANNISLATIKDVVENHCTLRQLCMFYAKVCYDQGRATKTPPANWAAKGYKEDTKYAAFDFFNGVLNPAVPKPQKGMKFQPTEVEIAAQAVNGTMAITESRQQANQFSNRGNMLAMQQIRTPAPPPLITFE